MALDFFTRALPLNVLASVHPDAQGLFGGQESFIGFLSNSFLVGVIVVSIVLFAASRATSKMTLVPHAWQNGFEFVVEFLYGQVEGIVGKKLAPRAFPLLGSLFIFILVSNWIGLVPGVGTIGWGEGTGGFASVAEVTKPLFRPPTADLNMTFGLAASAFLVWIWFTVREVGVWGFIVHTFGPKGGLTGLMGIVVAVVFMFVGVIEMISILFRPITLSFRLYGNVFAGEQVLHTMSGMGGFLGSILAPFPFYFMELLVGLLQAIVFTLLCAVYIQLSTSHDDHGEEDGAHH